MNVDTNQGRVTRILGLEEQATLVRDSRQVYVIDGGVYSEPDSPDDGILCRLNGSEIA